MSVRAEARAPPRGWQPPGDVCRTTGSTGPMAKGLDDHKARYRAATSEPSERDNRTV